MPLADSILYVWCEFRSSERAHRCHPILVRPDAESSMPSSSLQGQEQCQPVEAPAASGASLDSKTGLTEQLQEVHGDVTTTMLHIVRG